MPDKFNGLIQHSFALPMAERHWPFDGESIGELVAERFSVPLDGFCVSAVGDLSVSEVERVTSHSPLVRNHLTTVRARTTPSITRKHNLGYIPQELPPALLWAGADPIACDYDYDETRFAFADGWGEEMCGEPASANDFLVKHGAAGCHADEVSKALLELVAHQRSHLFGLALANRFVNVMLPHALLSPCSANACPANGCPPGPWLLQPLVTLVRVDDRDRVFRNIYTLTLFLIPIDHCADGQHAAREMPECEIGLMVNAGWGLASVPWEERIPQFCVSGPLPEYLPRLARRDLSGMLRWPEVPKLTLRQTTEATAFAVALGIAQGSGDLADRETTRKIGRDVVTALGSARVSSVVVVDPCLTSDDLRAGAPTSNPPGSLGGLAKTLAGATRVPDAGAWSRAELRKFRIDRSFVDNDSYAVGVLPTNRCMILTSAGRAQHGRSESALMQAGSVAYMTIGAATAIGAIRALDRKLETIRGSDPSRVADIEGEVANELHDIYDLDITREAYRAVYRSLRDRLAITRDYTALREKIEALDRETTTRHEVRGDALLAWLTAAIVALSLLILIVAMVK